MVGAAGSVAAGGAALVAALQGTVYARELELHPPHFAWSHWGHTEALDHSR